MRRFLCKIVIFRSHGFPPKNNKINLSFFTTFFQPTLIYYFSPKTIRKIPETDLVDVKDLDPGKGTAEIVTENVTGDHPDVIEAAVEIDLVEGLDHVLEIGLLDLMTGGVKETTGVLLNLKILPNLLFRIQINQE